MTLSLLALCCACSFTSIATEEPQENCSIQNSSLHQHLCDKLFALLETAPKDCLKHSLQCASIALKENEDERMVLAALFHSIGHIQQRKSSYVCSLDQCKASAETLRSYGISEYVCQLILGHFQVARYLKAKDSSMSPEEAVLFENDPLFNEKMRLWQLHEQSQLETSALPLSLYKDLPIRHLNNRISP